MERRQALRAARASIRRGRCVILIACSGRKEPGGSPWPDPQMCGLLDQVQPGDRATLLSVRRRLAPRAKAKPGPDVGGQSSRGRYRPVRYKGDVYRPVGHDLWTPPGRDAPVQSQLQSGRRWLPSPRPAK